VDQRWLRPSDDPQRDASGDSCPDSVFLQEVGLDPSEVAVSLIPIRRPGHLEVMIFQESAHKGRELSVVFDEQYAVRHISTDSAPWAP
jgi:hypothetical protein